MIQIHYSDMTLFRKCRRQWDWGSPNRHNLRPLKTAAPLWIGDGVHQALEAYYTKGQDPVKFFKSWARKNPNGFDLGNQLDMVLKMLEHYTWWAKKHDRLDRYKVLQSEMPMAIQLDPEKLGFTQDRVFYTFRVDGICTFQGAAKNGVYIAEYKTMATLADDALTLAEQASLYLWAVTKLLQTQVPVLGVIYTLLRKKAYPVPPFRKDATLDIETIEALKAQKEVAPEKLQALKQSESPFVWRRKVTRNQNELRDIEERIYQISREMLHDPEIYPTPDLVGCRLCAFREPCIAKNRGDRYQELLKVLYVGGGVDRQYVPILNEEL